MGNRFAGSLRGLIAASIALFCMGLVSACGQTLAGGTPVVTEGALTKTPIYGLDATRATSQVVSVTGKPFAQAVSVTIRAASAETNATQLCVPVSTAVGKGDAMLASFYVRGQAADGTDQANLAFLFERSLPPWRGSISQGVSTPRDPNAWKHVVIPFTAAEDYPLGQAQASLRFAFGPQTIEVGGLSVVDFGSTVTPEALASAAAERNPLGAVSVKVNRADVRQTLLGLGGDFCQPRYGSTTAMDPVGNYILAHLNVAQARVGIPLNTWAPQRGVYQDIGSAHAALLQMQMLAERHIPIIGTVWEGPAWMLPGQPEQSGRTLAPENYTDCIEAIAQFLVTARDKYGVTVADFSFNEANYGVNFLFTPGQISAFIEQAGPRFRSLGLKTKFLVGDTTGGMPFADYVRPILADQAAAPYLGALAFHCWDALSAPDDSYRAIAAIGRESNKPVWCTEGGYDAGLWQQPDPWGSWTNGLNTARAYVKTLRLSGAATVDYWTYQNNYQIVSSDGSTPYPIYYVISQMEDALPSGARVVATECDNDDVETLATVGPAPGQFSILLVNQDGAGTVTLSGLSEGSRIAVIVSDVNAQGHAVSLPSRISQSGNLSLEIPHRCVISVLGRR
jgi:O-glycosyl hydrolase